MKEILKVLKKYFIAILMVIVLLIAQAICDLKLPEFTSNIVNVGIQQNGFESPIYEVARKSTIEDMLLFTDDNTKKEIENVYTYISKDTLNDQEYEKYLKKYPLLKEEGLYVLKDLDKDQQEKIENMITKPSVLVSYLKSSNEVDFDAVKTQLSYLNASEKEATISKMLEKINGYEDSMLKQMAISLSIAEYKTVGVNIEQSQNNYILFTGLKMLGLAIAIMTITVLTIFLSSKIASGFSKDLRKKIFNKVMSFSNKEFEDFQTSSLITRSTNDVQQIQNFIIMSLRMIFYAPIVGVGAYLKVSGSSMSWIIGLDVAIILLIVTVLFSIVMPKFQIIQTMLDKLNLVTREILTGLPVIRAFGTEKHEEKRFDKANKDVTKISLFVNRVMTIMMPLMMFIMNGTSILIIWVGAGKVDNGSIQVGTLIVLITYTIQIIMSFIMISLLSVMIPRSVISIKRIAAVLNKNIAIKDKKETKNFDNTKKGIVEFKNVSFKYPDASENVINNVTFTAKKGTTTAFIGSTGSGKSTLINLIPRFYDVTEGEIIIDGVNIKDAKVKELREKIGYVPQKGMLFQGTIESNIKFGNDNLSDKELEKVAEISQSLEFINEKKNKYQTEISQGGTNVSGGQRQRLSIARAIATSPEIYIFDDSFSALDFQTDYKLRKALYEYTKDATIFIVAQRISTILNADQIVVLDKGNVVGIGTHKQLLKNCDIYKEIASSQLKEDELNA